MQPTSPAKAFQVARELTLDAYRYGATELFLGHPSPHRYEFLARGQRFGGKIHLSVIQPLISAVHSEGPQTISLEQGLVAKIGLTRNFEREILCITFTEGTQRSVEPFKTSSSFPIPIKQEPHTTAEVLLVDDDPRFLTILGKVLESKGYTVTSQQNAQTALELIQLKKISPALIISDIHMPVMDGGSFLRQLRQFDTRIPILMLTSDTDAETEAELALLGAEAFVRKQSNIAVLLAWCRNLLAHGAACRRP